MNSKSRLISMLLSLVFPGLGHFYIGLMKKGLIMMGLFVLNIGAIVYFAIHAFINPSNIILIVLSALFIPVIYFYTIFDAIHATNRWNNNIMNNWHEVTQDKDRKNKRDTEKHNGNMAIIFIFLIAFLLLMKNNFSWWHGYSLLTSSSIVGVVLIILGLFMLRSDSKNK